MFGSRKYVKPEYLGLAIAGLLIGIAAGQIVTPRRSEVAFLRVGQGDCAVVLHHGRVILIDAGPATEDYDQAERLVLPALRRLGVRSIDMLILTHPDTDHIGGVSTLARRYRIGAIVTSMLHVEHSEMQAELREAGLSSDNIIGVWGEERVEFPGLKLHIATPPVELSGSDNDGSLFVHVELEGHGFAFSGDAGMDVEEAMLERYPEWRAEVVRAGHHGSRTSSSEAWIRHLGAAYAVVSAGRNSRFNHPHADAVGRMRSAGSEVLETDEGTVRFLVTDEGLDLRRLQTP